MSTVVFPTDPEEIQARINAIDPQAYARTRNFLTGAVTRLSPYLSRGVINLADLKDRILADYPFRKAEKLIQELAWREYYQRVWQARGTAIFSDLKQLQPDVAHQQVPIALSQAATQIEAIDQAINDLYTTGYMHNHCRMYCAMLACNIAHAHWSAPASWMYYHLLDGDLASNSLSWQWVAGSFSSKKYIANQDNINTYTGSKQVYSYLAVDYARLQHLPTPDVLKSSAPFLLKTILPPSEDPLVVENAPLFVYNSYQIDPQWHAQEKGNRVLLLERDHFERFPVSSLVLNFIIELARKQVPDIRIFCGSFDELTSRKGFTDIYYKEHPLSTHYRGRKEERSWMFPEISGYYPSFFSYWKKCERYL